MRNKGYSGMIRMLNNLQLSAVLAFLILLLPPLTSSADEEVQDKIFISELNGELNAVIDGAKNSTTRLGPKEGVLWEDSSGYLGAVLTNDRFYVVSTTSGTWKEFPLKSQEAEQAKVSLSPYIALLATDDRAICYNISTHSYFETKLPVGAELIAVEAGRYIAVVVTTDKLLGIRKGSSSFTEMRLGIDEAVENVDVTSNKVVVRTSDRLLSLVADDTKWTEYKL
jgi:hypothetical protein